MAKIKDITSIVQRAVDEATAAIKSINDLILQMPDNDKIQRINSNCFVMQSSVLMASASWSPEYHDFKFQYACIANALSKESILNVVPKFKKIITDGELMSKLPAIIYFSNERTEIARKIKLHPTVINNLKQLL